jgi:para-aminobenzoate synthetase component 2
MVLLIDNYDSFTYNLYHYCGRFHSDIQVFRNDRISLDQIESLSPDAIIISPGPKTPLEAGLSCDIIEHFHKTVPIFGVCLGHQSMGHVFGGRVSRAPEIMHGKISSIHHDGKGIFKGLPDPLDVVRYHSLIVEKDSFPDCLEVTSSTDKGLVMGLRHREYPHMEGVQFHPESIKTEQGYAMMENFLRTAGLVK